MCAPIPFREISPNSHYRAAFIINLLHPTKLLKQHNSTLLVAENQQNLTKNRGIPGKPQTLKTFLPSCLSG